MLNTPLLTTSYWFESLPTPFIGWVRIALLVFFGALAVGGIVLRVLSVRAGGNMYLARGGARAGKLGLAMGVIGLLLTWFTEQQISFFGERFWFLLWAAVFVPWSISILRELLTVIPKRAAEFAEKARIEKYLPHAK